MEEDKQQTLNMYKMCKICFIIGKHKYSSFFLFIAEASYFGDDLIL